MDAEPANQNWFEVKYEEVFDNRPNLWYYGEGNCGLPNKFGTNLIKPLC
ncbi:hypothetical protein [Tenacibaculum maritimum]|nr:hypothetical protein [Tenacibaculum maritimum]